MFAGCVASEWIKVGNGFSRGSFDGSPVKYWNIVNVDETGAVTGVVSGPYANGSLPKPGVGKYFYFAPDTPVPFYWSLSEDGTLDTAPEAQHTYKVSYSLAKMQTEPLPEGKDHYDWGVLLTATVDKADGTT